jgi:LysR family transcriptional regulator, glycine cleavage system transcriptional activator
LTQRPRRFLPSVSLLVAFDAVLTTGSTAEAARSLGMSQSTVSRLISTLESQLGRPLFERHRKRLVPTRAARAYGREIARALDVVQRASMEFVANPDGGNLTLATLPAFGTRWLAPRLGDFLALNPGITVNLVTRVSAGLPDAGGIDAAITFGPGGWPGAATMQLFSERLTACAAPALLERHPIHGPSDLTGLPLLQIETRPGAWAAWFRGQGAPEGRPAGMLFDQFAPMIQAAISGLGVALLPGYIAEREIAEGRLAAILQPDVAGDGAYWLVWPDHKSDHPPLEAFRDWIAGVIA